MQQVQIVDSIATVKKVKSGVNKATQFRLDRVCPRNLFGRGNSTAVGPRIRIIPASGGPYTFRFLKIEKTASPLGRYDILISI